MSKSNLIITICCILLCVLLYGIILSVTSIEKQYLEMEVSSSEEFCIVELYKNGDKDIKNKIKLLNSDGVITNKEYAELKDYASSIDRKSKLEAQKKILKELINE